MSTAYFLKLPSAIRIVILQFIRQLEVHLTISSGILLFLRLQRSRSLLTLSKAPKTSRNSTLATYLRSQVAQIYSTTRCSTYSVEVAFRPPIYIYSRSQYRSARYTIRLIITMFITLPSVLSSAIGLQDFGSLYVSFPSFRSTTVRPSRNYSRQ